MEKDPWEALSSSLNASAYTTLGLLENTAVQGKESQAISLFSPDCYPAPLHIPAAAKTIVRYVPQEDKAESTC